MESSTTPRKTSSHYYGDLVRVIFVVAAAFLLLGLPRVTELFQVSVVLPIAGIAILGIAAGITNPVQMSSLKANSIISIIFLVVFAYMSWYSYTMNVGNGVELANQIMAILFLVASYFSIKSLRGAQTQ